MLSLPSQATRAQRLSGYHSRTALSYGGGTSTLTTNCSPLNVPPNAQWNQCPYWGALDLDLHSRVFLGLGTSRAVCRSVAHTTAVCPRINPSATFPEPTSAKSTSYVRDQQPFRTQTTNQLLTRRTTGRHACFQ